MEEEPRVHLERESSPRLKPPRAPPPSFGSCGGTWPSPKFHSVKLSLGLFLPTPGILSEHQLFSVRV